MFSPEKMFCYSDQFVEKKKEGSHFVQGLVNIVVGGRTDQSISNIFSSEILAECGLTL